MTKPPPDDFIRDIEAAVIARDRAMENDDLEWARHNLPASMSADAVERAFHAARVLCVGVSLAKRQASLDWLAARGDKGYNA